MRTKDRVSSPGVSPSGIRTKGKLLFSRVGHHGAAYMAPPFHYSQAPRVQSDGSFFLYIFS